MMRAKLASAVVVAHVMDRIGGGRADAGHRGRSRAQPDRGDVGHRREQRGAHQSRRDSRAARRRGAGRRAQRSLARRHAVPPLHPDVGGHAVRDRSRRSRTQMAAWQAQFVKGGTQHGFTNTGTSTVTIVEIFVKK